MMEEKLKLLPSWMFIFLITDFVIVLIILLAVSKDKEPQETIQMMLIIGAVFTLLLVILNYIHFKVKMDYRYFSVKMVPFALKPRMIASEDIVAWKIRPLRFMREFSGYGKRKKGDTTAYVVDSKFAIEFDLRDGNKMVVSIRNKDEWQRIFERSNTWIDKMRMD